MLNPDFRLAAGASHGTVGVAWTAPAGNSVSFVFVDGRMAVEAFTPGIAERAIDVPLAAGALAVIEVHDIGPGDVPADTPPRAITIPPTAYTRPAIHFAAVPGAARYRLYHRPEDGIESRVWEAAASPMDGEWVTLECPVDLVGQSTASGGLGRWHFFRVETVSVYGVESRAKAWVWRALDVPVAPRVSVAPGAESGTYTFTMIGG